MGISTQSLAPQRDQEVDVTYVPLTGLVGSVGGNVIWEAGNRVLLATVGERTATARVGSTDIDVDGHRVRISAPPILRDDVVYVPEDFLEDVFGFAITATGERVEIRR